MAIMIPPQCNPKSPASERDVFKDMKEKLPDEWTVFYSFRFRGDNEKEHKTDHDGEADFVLFHPDYGMLVLEVKGGEISYEHNQWWQYDHQINPIEQVLNNKNNIIALFRRRLGVEKLPVKIVHAVCFPDCYELDPNDKTWPEEARGLVLTNESLKNNDLERIVISIINNARYSWDNNKHITRQTVLDIMSPYIVCEPVNECNIPREELKVLLLSKQQMSILNALQNFKRLIFRGGAGTGKTFLAVQKAKMLADQGKKVLLLCYNELLAKQLKKAIEKYESCDSISVRKFFEFCIQEAEIPENKIAQLRNDPERYNNDLPQYMNEAIAKKNLQDNYDAVIVDEGQDFAPNIWETISKLVREDSAFYIFYDPNQNVYGKEIRLPDFGIPEIVLDTNCRNTKKIFQKMKDCYETKDKIFDEAPEGLEVRVLKGNSREILTEELKRILLEEKICIQDVVVLGGHNLEHTSVGNNPQVGEYTLVERDIKLGACEVAYRTYMKFKGCEAKVVILLDVDSNDERWDKVGLYTAMSRAVHELVILEK